MATEASRDKMLELAVSTIEKQFGKGSIMRLGAEGAVIKDIAVR
jgi:recombination protein RecA